jgi:dihydropteroate synthase
MNENPRIWRCGAYTLSLDEPLVMGVLNVTPDSFSDGGTFEDPGRAVVRGERIIAEGGAIIDVGGESTRPGSDAVPHLEELARVRPVVQRLATEGVPVSVDTRHATVATDCIKAGASIINDVSGFRDPAMVAAAVGSDCGVVVMHMLGKPKTMQEEPHYTDVAAEVGGFLLAQAAALEEAGVARERIVLDPGIGFGKTLEHNLALLRGIPVLAAHGYPILIGASRKHFIGEIGGEKEPAARVGGSIAAAVEAVRLGAAVVRVHDVAATVEALAVSRAIRG